MANKIQFRRGTDGQRGGVTFDSGEPAWTTDTKKLYIGDGTTAGGVEVTGGGGSSTWIGLTDTDPTTFGGQAGKYVKVNAGADGLDFGTPSGSGDMTKCYTPDTDVLTVNGFMPVAGIENGDEICTLNPDTHEIEYQKVSRTFKYQYVGNMYHIDSQQVDLVVTPTHKMFVKKRAYSSPREFELVEARDIFGKRIRYKKDGMWGGEDVDFILPSVEFNGSNGKRCEDAVDIPIVLWAEFMGYYLSEGSCGQYASGGSTIDYKVCITQNQDSPYFDAMLQCASKISNYINRNAFVNGRSIVISSKQLQSYLSQFGKVYDKHVPPEIKNATPATIQKFLEAYVFGDGHISTTCNRVTPKWDIFTTSEQMVDDLQELSLKAGWAANSSVCIEKGYVNTINGRTVVAQADCYRVAINKRKLNPQMNHGHVKPQNGQHEEWVHYDGHVYSVEVPKYHVIYVRRNGKTVWSGNSTYDPNADGIFAIANGGTGQATAQAAMDAISQVAGATNEHVLTKDTGTGNATWKVGGGGGVTDHGALTGLADDDHSQYLLVAGTRAMTGNLDMGGNDIDDVIVLTAPSNTTGLHLVGGTDTHNTVLASYGTAHASEAGNIVMYVPNAAADGTLTAVRISGKTDTPIVDIFYGLDINSKKIENLGAGTPRSSDAARMSDISGGSAIVVAANDSSEIDKRRADYVCDGTDDQVTIQAILDGLSAEAKGVFFMQGTYDMGYTSGYGSINILQDDLTLGGAGDLTIFKRNSGLGSTHPVIVVGTDFGHVNNLTLSNFKIGGNNLQGMGIRSRGSDLSNISIHDIAIADTATAGKVSDEAIRIYANTEKTCENISVRNCRLDNTGGLCIFECNNVFIADNRVLNSVWDAPASPSNGAIRCTGNNLLKVVDNIIDNVSCNSNTHLANGISLGNSTNFKVDSNILNNVAGHGINVQTAAHYGTINNNTLSNIDYEHICVEYGDSSYINIIGNTGYNAGMYGIWVSGEVDVPVDAGDVASYIKISDNILHDCGNNSAGIRAYHADKIQILNNIIHDCGNEGISLHSVHGCLVQGNLISKTCQTSHDASIFLSVHTTGGCYLCKDNVVLDNYIIENDTIKPTHAIEEVAGGNVYDNIFRNNITDGFVSAQKTENSGTATISSAGTSVVVTHGLRSTPAAGDIMVVPLETWGNMTKFWIDSYTATQFTIHADQAPGANKLFAWKAIVL